MTSIYPVFGETDKDTLDFVLKRNWFLDDESILEELDWANQEAWDYVCANRESYPERVRECIWRTKYPTKMRVLDFTDDDLRKIEVRRLIELEDKFEEAWKVEKENVPERPYGDIDSQLDDAWSSLASMKNQSRSYVPPSKVKALNEKIESLENEFERLNKAVQQADSDYVSKYKDDFKFTWMRDL
jgi:hypothetical protein